MDASISSDRFSDEPMPADIPLNAVERFLEKREVLLVGLLASVLFMGTLFAGVVLLVANSGRHGEGTTHSSKVNLEQRQLEIQQAELEAQAVGEQRS
jgi:hypothetical protein